MTTTQSVWQMQVKLRDQLMSSSAQLQRLHDAIEESDALQAKVWRGL